MTRPKARIALVQTSSTDDFPANLAFALEQLGAAQAGGAALVAYPEVFLYIGGREGKLAHAQSLEGEVVARFREEAARRRLWILLGSLHERILGREDKVHNTSVLIGPAGAIAGIYRKRNLFDVELPGQRILESETIAPGEDAAPVIQTDLGQVGLTICFDLRFPALYRQLRRAGAEIVFVPSNFTFPTGAAHWEVLLRARAIENQVYLVAPAQVGRHNAKYSSYGHSALVDPWGTITALAPDRPGILFGEIDLGYLDQVRAQIPMRGEG
jgi:predicted amidohydrolase